MQTVFRLFMCTVDALKIAHTRIRVQINLEPSLKYFV